MAPTVQGSSRLDSGEGCSIRPHPSPPPCVTPPLGVVCAPMPRELCACALLLLALGASWTRGGGDAGPPGSTPPPAPTTIGPDRTTPTAAPRTSTSAEACDTGVSTARGRGGPSSGSTLTAGTVTPQSSAVAPPGM